METIKERIDAKRLASAVNMLKVIAHPVRLGIVDLLTTHPQLTVLDIQEKMGLPQAIASQHLTLMEDKGVLISEKIGRNKYISLRFPNMKHIVICIEHCCTVL
jgi:ArsR family transcriptional regulator